MCTSSAAVFWFDAPDDRAAAYDMVAGTAASDELVHYAEGYNWFLADVSETSIGIPGRLTWSTWLINWMPDTRRVPFTPR